MAFKWSDRSINNMGGVKSLLIRCATLALKGSRCGTLRPSKRDMKIPDHGGFRTAEEQYGLFKRGWSKADGYKKKSKHQDGDALDVWSLHQRDFLDDMTPEMIEEANKDYRHFAKQMFTAFQWMQKKGEVPENVYLEYGGHWTNFLDLPHWNLSYR